MDLHHTPSGKRAIYYYSNWSGYERNFQVSDIPIKYIVDIAYAYWIVLEDGTVQTTDTWIDLEKKFLNKDSIHPVDSYDSKKGFFGNFRQFKKLKDLGNKFNILLTINGNSNNNLSTVISSEFTRINFIKNLLNIYRNYPIFSGVIIEWEHPINNYDNNNLVEFFKQFKCALIDNGISNYIIAFCISGKKCVWDTPVLEPFIDQLHIKTFDFYTGFEKTSGFHTNSRKSSKSDFSCEQTIDTYLDLGIPSKKIFIGGAFYSRGFISDNIGKLSIGASTDLSIEPNSVDYKDLPLSGSIEIFDDESKSVYSYDSKKHIINTYDNIDSIKDKCKLINEKDIGGIFIWETSRDFHISHDKSLVKTIYNNLTHNKQPTLDQHFTIDQNLINLKRNIQRNTSVITDSLLSINIPGFNKTFKFTLPNNNYKFIDYKYNNNKILLTLQKI